MVSCTAGCAVADMDGFIRGVPKCELHLHIEGTLEPEMMFSLARRNNVHIPYDSPDEVRAAYNFKNLQDFLDIYYEGCKVLVTEQDFYDLTWAYAEHCREDNTRHAEIFFDPQSHTDRGIAFEIVIGGIHRALKDAEEQFGMTSRIIMCFLRHLTPEAAVATLQMSLPYKDKIDGVGLDSSEKDRPPELFKEAFDLARDAGYGFSVAHAGEEGPPCYIRQALDLLRVRRVDHGVRCIEDPELMRRLVNERIPLTCCPLSNVKLRVFDRLEDSNYDKLLQMGVQVTLNSDDPAYFGGYLTDNFIATVAALDMSRRDVVQLCANAFKASVLPPPLIMAQLQALDAYARKNGVGIGDDEDMDDGSMPIGAAV